VALVFSKVASVTDIIGASVKERKQVNPNPRCHNFNKILKKQYDGFELTSEAFTDIKFTVWRIHANN
jgi:hypothetical protein